MVDLLMEETKRQRTRIIMVTDSIGHTPMETSGEVHNSGLDFNLEIEK